MSKNTKKVNLPDYDDSEGFENALSAVGRRMTFLFIDTILTELGHTDDSIRIELEYHPKSHPDNEFGPSISYVIEDRGKRVADIVQGEEVEDMEDGFE